MAGTEITIEVRGLSELTNKLGAVGVTALLGGPIRKGLTVSALLVEGEAKKLVPVDTGNLRRTITHKVDGSPIPAFATIGTDASYARAVHDGRRAGAKMPPLSALKGWAGRHGVPGNRVFLVARAISRKGIRARPFLTDAMRAKVGQIEAAMRGAAAEIEQHWRS